MEWNHTCANGVEIIARTNPHLHKFCAILELYCGSAYEREEERGITHVLEHCVMRGMTARYGKDFYGLLTRNGLMLDAWTNTQTMRFELYGHPEGAGFAAELVEKMLLPIELSQEEFQIETGRILAEMDATAESWMTRVIRDTAGGGSGYWNDVCGNTSVVEGFTLQQVEQHHRAVLKTGRVRLCLTGCLGQEALERFALAAELIPMEPGVFPFPEPKMPLYFGERTGVWRYENAHRDLLELVFDVNAYRHSLDTLVVLWSILQSGCDALLYQELSEKRALAYHISRPLILSPQGALIQIGFDYDPARLPESIDAVRLALERLLAGDFDLEAKKRFCLRQWEWEMDDPCEHGRNLLQMLRLTRCAQMPEFLEVTKEEVIGCAREIFCGDHFLTMLFCCEPTVEEERAKTALDRLKALGTEM